MCNLFGIAFASVTSCTGGGGSAASGVDFKGKNIGMLPPS